MTQANWIQGQPCLLPPPQTYEELYKKSSDLKTNNCIDWYLCFNKGFNTLPMYGAMSNQLPFNSANTLENATINSQTFSNSINRYMY